jgi:hypothetical protein
MEEIAIRPVRQHVIVVAIVSAENPSDEYGGIFDPRID